MLTFYYLHHRKEIKKVVINKEEVYSSVMLYFPDIPGELVNNKYSHIMYPIIKVLIN